MSLGLNPLRSGLGFNALKHLVLFDEENKSLNPLRSGLGFN